MATSELKVDVVTATSFTIAATYGNIGTGADELTGTFTPASADSVILLILHIDVGGATSDASATFRFTNGGTAISGGPVLLASLDATEEYNSLHMMHAVTGLTGSQTFAVEGQIVGGTPSTSSSREHSFQVIEITSGATIEVDISATDDVTAPAATGFVVVGGTPNLTGTFTPTAGAVQLMILNLPQVGNSDRFIRSRFSVGGTLEGPMMRLSTDAATPVIYDQGMAWISSGNAASSTAFEAHWEGSTSSCKSGADGDGKVRTFQVIELTSDVATLRTDVTTTGTVSAPSGYADVASHSDAAITVDSTDSVVLALSHLPPIFAADETAEFRFDFNGTQYGPECMVFVDLTLVGASASLTYAKTGLSGSSNDIALQWNIVAGTIQSQASEQRTFQVLDLKNAAAASSIIPQGTNRGILRGLGRGIS